MVKQFIIRNTNLHIIYYETMHYVIYLIYFKKYLVLSKICVYLSVSRNTNKIPYINHDSHVYKFYLFCNKFD